MTERSAPSINDGLDELEAEIHRAVFEARRDRAEIARLREENVRLRAAIAKVRGMEG